MVTYLTVIKLNPYNDELFESKLFFPMTQTCTINPDLDQVWYGIYQLNETNPNIMTISANYLT